MCPQCLGTLWLGQRGQAEGRRREGPPHVRLPMPQIWMGGKLWGLGQRNAHSVPFILLGSVASDMDLQNSVVSKDGVWD